MADADTLAGMGTRGRFGFWFPLALLGFLALGSAAFAQGGWWVDAHAGDVVAHLRGLGMSRAYENQLLTPGAMYGLGAGRGSDNPEYWIFGVAFVFLAVVAWYAHGSERVRAVVLAAVCGVVGIVAFSCMMWIIEEAPGLALTVAGSLLVLGLCTAAWVYFQLGRGRSGLIAVSVVTLAVGAMGLLAVWTNYRADELLLIGALLVLAWWERSLLIAALAAVFLVVGAVSLPTLIELVIVTGLLFVCAFVALARRHGQATAQ